MLTITNTAGATEQQLLVDKARLTVLGATALVQALGQLRAP
jgi:hypothetical protein